MSELGNEREDARQDDVARRAYERWLARGGEHGGDLEDWIEAEREVRSTGTTPYGSTSAERQAMTEPSAVASDAMSPEAPVAARSAPKRRSRAKPRGGDAPDVQG